MVETTQIIIQKLVETYGLRPHPEGGYFKETYRSAESIHKSALHSRFEGDRNYSTTIYFLLPEGKKSCLHRLKADEVWHFYLGGSLTLVQIYMNSKTEKVVMGQDIDKGQKLQHVVPAGCWFGAYPNPGSGFAFVGCTVAPGFDFADFEMGNRQGLLKQFPQAREIIEKLTD